MKNIKIDEDIAREHYKSIVESTEDISEINNTITFDCVSNITVNAKSKSAYEYSVSLENLVEKCIDKDASVLNMMNQAFLRTDEDSEKMIELLSKDYK